MCQRAPSQISVTEARSWMTQVAEPSICSAALPSIVTVLVESLVCLTMISRPAEEATAGKVTVIA